MTHQTQSGNHHSMPLGDTITSGAIDEIARVLNAGFSALHECGLPVPQHDIVDDVYTDIVQHIADVIAHGNPAFDRKKFLVAVWSSKPIRSL